MLPNADLSIGYPMVLVVNTKKRVDNWSPNIPVLVKRLKSQKQGKTFNQFGVLLAQVQILPFFHLNIFFVSLSRI
jgi:hypothetical protein